MSPDTFTDYSDNISKTQNEFFSEKENINYVSLFTWDGNIVEFNPVVSMGSIMFTSYPLWLIVTSLILLLAMVGVIVITINTTENNDIKNTNNIEVYTNK